MLPYLNIDAAYRISTYKLLTVSHHSFLSTRSHVLATAVNEMLYMHAGELPTFPRPAERQMSDRWPQSTWWEEEKCKNQNRLPRWVAYNACNIAAGFVVSIDGSLSVKRACRNHTSIEPSCLLSCCRKELENPQMPSERVPYSLAMATHKHQYERKQQVDRKSPYLRSLLGHSPGCTTCNQWRWCQSMTWWHTKDRWLCLCLLNCWQCWQRVV